MKTFATEKAAKEYFQEIDVEPCELCGFYSASRADTEDGGIIGPMVVNDETVFERICFECDD